jgi:phosphoglycerate dehydrogenase-like enzyme
VLAILAGESERNGAPWPRGTVIVACGGECTVNLGPDADALFGKGGPRAGPARRPRSGPRSPWTASKGLKGVVAMFADTDGSDGATPRVAVGPAPADWAAEAIRRGGGEPVTLDQEPTGLVWTDGSAMDRLRATLAVQPGISWVQLPQAGIERAVAAGVIDHERRWTSAKGAFAEPVAEHALALLLAGLRMLKIRAQARSWGEPGGVSLFDQPVTVVGGGGIATVLLRLLEPFRARVTVVRRHPEPVPGAVRTIGADRLAEALPGALAVVLTLALTPQTRGLIGRDELAAMGSGSWLVNVARGGLVDTGALTDALRTGQIGGAALDVTDPEPLPPGHPLFYLPNCLITPHTADTEEMTRPLLADRIAENVRRLAAGQELVGLVDPDLGY